MRQELHATLTQLHQELAQADRLDEQSIQSLKILAKDIQSLLERTQNANATGDTFEADSSMSSRIQGMVEQFETRHPQLSSTLSMIAERLSDMGI